MKNLREFLEELNELCNKYGYVLNGRTTNGSVVVTKGNCECGIISKRNFNAHIDCKGE